MHTEPVGGRRLLAILTVGLGVALSAAPPAQALRHEWGVASGGNPNPCTAVPVDTRCYDAIPTYFHTWRTLRVKRYDIGSNRRICVKAVTAADNAKAMAYSQCSDGASEWNNVILFPDDSTHRAYVFWASGNGSQTPTVGLNGAANTD